MKPESHQQSSEERLQRARTGDADHLIAFVNERNQQVIDALLQNPLLPTSMVLTFLRQRILTSIQLQKISSNLKWVKDYKVRFELIMDPKTPRAISIQYVKDLYQTDLAMISRTITVHPAVRASAENYLTLRMTSMTVGEKIALAKIAPIGILRVLLEDTDTRVVETVLNNYRMTEIEIMRFASMKNRPKDILDLLVHHPKWSLSQSVLQLLASHPRVGYESKRRIFERIHLPLLIQLLHAPQLNDNYRKLARFVCHQRLRELPETMLIQMAQSSSKRILYELCQIIQNDRILDLLLSNRRIDVQFIEHLLKKNKLPQLVQLISAHDNWRGDQRVQQMCAISQKAEGQTRESTYSVENIPKIDHGLIDQHAREILGEIAPDSEDPSPSQQ